MLGCLFLLSDGCVGTVIQSAVTVVGKVLADFLTNFPMTDTSFCSTDFERPTSRIIGTDGIVWYHDGMTTGSSCENDGDLDKFSSGNLLKCKGKKLILVVYARVGEMVMGGWVALF
jgi:hypothetical protein